ncbi:uncharacterized protein LOC132704807 isoform X5 [Cylas formicarius]|uniref:uncharacterized protein LOC132704807 isoform X5 n=1 Tax=Cylas formicarius TaxID=197179 RepID=UPI00295850C0|nr:uncharacterized protein LOC132704807 isoform X5 [Cylas formicarius]
MSLISQTQNWMALLVYLFLLGLLSAAAHEGLPLLAPGGIGGIFKGPDSETIIQGPDGSVITSEQEGGAVVRGNGLEQPIVVAESVQEIESDHAIEQVLIQEQPKVQSEIAQGILLKTVPAPQNQFPGPQPVLTEIKQSPFIESTATIQQNQPILLKEAAEAAESAKLLVEPIRQPLSVSRVPVLTHKFSVSNLEPVVSSTAAPLGQSTALPSSTPRTLLEISNANLIESDKINLGDVRSLNRGLPQLQHRSSNGFVGNPELILNENLVSFSDAQLVSSNAADLTKAKEQIQRVPLEKFILADETLDIENIAGGQILNQAKLVNSQPIPLGQYILQDQKSVIPQADNEGTLNQAKAGQGPQIPLNQYILIQDRLANPKVTREQILRPGNELGQDDLTLFIHSPVFHTRHLLSPDFRDSTNDFGNSASSSNLYPQIALSRESPHIQKVPKKANFVSVDGRIDMGRPDFIESQYVPENLRVELSRFLRKVPMSSKHIKIDDKLGNLVENEVALKNRPNIYSTASDLGKGSLIVPQLERNGIDPSKVNFAPVSLSEVKEIRGPLFTPEQKIEYDLWNRYARNAEEINKKG